jgi:hypothetical protein
LHQDKPPQRGQIQQMQPPHTPQLHNHQPQPPQPQPWAVPLHPLLPQERQPWVMADA